MIILLSKIYGVFENDVHFQTAGEVRRLLFLISECNTYCTEDGGTTFNSVLYSFLVVVFLWLWRGLCVDPAAWAWTESLISLLAASSRNSALVEHTHTDLDV